MFKESAAIYDLIYSFKDYKTESEKIRDIIDSTRPGSRDILDVGCGTAEHHKYLKEYYRIDGLDLNDKFIEQAKVKNPQGNYTLGNMVNFNIDKKYDVIICLFSSIGYLKSEKDIIAALSCFNRHLETTGLLIVEPWFESDPLSSGRIEMTNYEKDDLKICRMIHSHSDEEFSYLNFKYLVGTPDKGIQYFSEDHQLRMTARDEMQNAFHKAGFNVAYNNENCLSGRGMYYGIKSDFLKL